MNIIFKPFMLGVYVTIALGVSVATIGSIFLTNSHLSVINNEQNSKTKHIDVVSKLKIEAPKVLKVRKKIIKQKEIAGSYLLKDFSISAISYDGDDSMVIARNKRDGKFLYLGDSFKGYKLKEVYISKAVFTKKGNSYYTFLSPDDEKSFKEISAVAGGTKTIIKREKVTGSIAKSMFEDIKYKNGIYYIPEDTLLEFNDLKKIFRSIGIQGFNKNGTIKYKVVRVNPKSVFGKIGLQRGDFILAVNGEKFKSMMGPVKYFNNLQNIKSMSITIKRGKKTKELKYEIF